MSASARVVVTAAMLVGGTAYLHLHEHPPLPLTLTPTRGFTTSAANPPASGGGGGGGGGGDGGGGGGGGRGEQDTANRRTDRASGTPVPQNTRCN